MQSSLFPSIVSVLEASEKTLEKSSEASPESKKAVLDYANSVIERLETLQNELREVCELLAQKDMTEREVEIMKELVEEIEG